VNRFKNRLPIRRFAVAIRVAMVGLIGVLAAVLSGCSAGQIAQTAAQEPAVNGSLLNIHNAVALRDIRIQAEQKTGDYIEAGRPVELVLVAINQKPDATDRLVDIISDVGKVTISGDRQLPAGGMLFIGTPPGQRIAPGPLGSNAVAKAIVNLTDHITNGLIYKFTFIFEHAGQDSVWVPVSAPPAPPSV
jgi:hypothetical protein